MPINTGFEIIDAVINNPMEAVILFVIAVVIHRILFQRDGMYCDIRRGVQFKIRWGINDSLYWLDRRDKAYGSWRKKQSNERMLYYSLFLISLPFLPSLIWGVLFTTQYSLFLNIILLCEYLFFISSIVINYKKVRRKLGEIKID